MPPKQPLEQPLRVVLGQGLIGVRWHGRAGQGVVTASELLAEAALREGKYVQAFPDYGAERMGAPVEAYTRLSEQPIEVHYGILQPDVVVVVNPNLIGVEPVTEGLGEDGVLIANTPASPSELRERIDLHTGHVFVVDGTRIALDVLGRDIPSTPMLGAVVKVVGLVGLDTLLGVARGKLAERLGPEVVEANIMAIRRAYDEVRGDA